MWRQSVFIIFWIFALSAVIGQSPVLDSRCYLEGGGSAESFLATEDMAIGSIIGKLRINGNPHTELGDINLSLRERGSAVEISPGTKNVVLVTALDKEGVQGPASVYVNVICDRRHSSDPSFVIPVNIRVTDVNDNAPQWIGAPYSLPLSEVTVPGTRILQGARAIDKDQQGPFSTVEYKVLTGLYSDYVAFVSPLEGTLVLRKPLDYETLRNFTVTLRAQDQGTPPKFSDTTLRVLVEDADDQNPKFLKDSYRAELPATEYVGELTVLPEPIRAVDQDEGLRAPVEYAMLPSDESKYFAINSATGMVTVVAAPSPADGLNVMHTITLVIRATQINNSDRYALTTLVVSGKENPKKHDGSHLQFLQPKYNTKVPENVSVGNRLLALPTNRPGRFLRYSILTDGNPSDATTYFAIGTLGEVILRKSLDFEKAMRHQFRVQATDGSTNATTDVAIEVLDVNDWEPRFRQNHYDFSAPSRSDGALAEPPVALGKLEAADGDKNDRVTIAIRGAHAQYFSIDTQGMLWLKAHLPDNATLLHLIATATDSGMPARSSSVPVTVTVEGAIARAQHQQWWTPVMLGSVGFIFSIFMLVIVVMSIYIYKQKPTRSKNRVHSHDHSVVGSASNFVNHEKIGGSGSTRLANPLNTGLRGSAGSSVSAGASTILAASLERERAREREREKENYTATVRSIITRASAARNGRLYDTTDMEQDSISDTERTTVTTAWNIPHANGGGGGDGGSPDENDALHRTSKKLSWNNGVMGSSNLLPKTDFSGSTDTVENNLTVYF